MWRRAQRSISPLSLPRRSHNPDVTPRPYGGGMFATVTSVALVGVEPRPVRVEVHVGSPRKGFALVGLPDTAVREAKDRVRAAVVSSGFPFPNRHVTVNLAPADLPKAGSAYDLPIALGVLTAARTVPPNVGSVVALGELALDGAVRSARGGLGAGMVARDAGVPCLLSQAAAGEATRVPGAQVRAVRSLSEAVAVAQGAPGAPVLTPEPVTTKESLDLADVRGQSAGRRALEIAAAGRHHLLMWGPPGAGKTMLAVRLPGILPPLDDEAALEVAQAWGAAGRAAPSPSTPPFRAPHHSATMPAIIGGGSGVPVLGEISLAHHGVLFLDELGEFPVHILDALRQPLEAGSVVIARKGISVRFPSDIQLVAATNPCPCGYAGDRIKACTCSVGSVQRYRRRFSGPLLDRFDLRVPVPRPERSELLGPPGEASAAIAERVQVARRLQDERGVQNANLGRSQLDALAWTPSASRLLETAVERFALTGRGFDRVRRVARTVADLDGVTPVDEPHVAEALSFRGEW